jgi:hypothetical protein
MGRSALEEYKDHSAVKSYDDVQLEKQHLIAKTDWLTDGPTN